MKNFITAVKNMAKQQQYAYSNLEKYFMRYVSTDEEFFATLNTVEMAMHFVDFTDKKAEKLIHDFLKNPKNNPFYEFNELFVNLPEDKKLYFLELLDETDLENINFDEATQKLFEFLKENGYSEDDEICKIRVKQNDDNEEKSKSDAQEDESSDNESSVWIDFNVGEDEDDDYWDEDYNWEENEDDNEEEDDEEDFLDDILNDEEDYEEDEEYDDEDDEIFFGIGKEEKEEEVEEEKIEFFEVAKKLHKELPKIIIGQDMAVEKIVDSFKNTLDFTPDRPMMTYMFLGAPGTGKTFLAKNLEKFLDGYKLKVFDMSQYIRHDSALTLRGTDRRFSGTTPGELTSFVLHNPKAIIVFDEFEKAHNDVQNELLTIFEGAYMVDKCGWYKDDDGNFIPITDEVKKVKRSGKYDNYERIDRVDFSKTIIIFTSNAGKELYKSDKFWKLIKNDYKKAENMILNHLSKETKIQESREVPIITPPMLSRISKGELIFFKELELEELIRIGRKKLSEYITRIEDKYNLKILNDNFEKLVKLLVLTYSPELNIRRITNKIGSDFFDLITDYLLYNDISFDDVETIKVEFSNEAEKFLNEFKYTKNDLFRKNLTITFKKDIELKDKELTITITDIEFSRIFNLKDFESGLVFELPDVNFSSIVGHNKVKEKLKEIVKILQNKDKIEKFKIKPPKGMLLYGPPGTGKTMLAKALANEAEMPFLQVTGTDLLDIDKIKKVFSMAKDYAPSIIFIDEIDAIGNRRIDRGKEIFINELLTQLDGFNEENEVFVIAATNYKERIDEALLRSGRLDLHMYVPHLDRDARRAFIKKILDSFEKEGEFDIEKLVLHTTGMNGADLAKVKRETALYMIKEGIEKLTEEILIEQINTIKYGEKIEKEKVKELLESTAIHESGHAVILKTLFPNKRVEQITITARSNALGFVSLEEEEIKNLTKKDIFNQLCILLAGRLAQIKKYGESGIDTGASDDLKKATNLAYQAIAYYGMDEEFGMANLENLENEEIRNEVTKRAIKWIEKAKTKTEQLINENWDKIEKCANLLIENEVIYNDDIEKVIKGEKDEKGI